MQRECTRGCPAPSAPRAGRPRPCRSPPCRSPPCPRPAASPRGVARSSARRARALVAWRRRRSPQCPPSSPASRPLFSPPAGRWPEGWTPRGPGGACGSGGALPRAGRGACRAPAGRCAAGGRSGAAWSPGTQQYFRCRGPTQRCRSRPRGRRRAARSAAQEQRGTYGCSCAPSRSQGRLQRSCAHPRCEWRAPRRLAARRRASVAYLTLPSASLVPRLGRRGGAQSQRVRAAWPPGSAPAGETFLRSGRGARV
mmetsp:Transcript_10805/g.44269  ORF Transcript_10805/g.44269 Transcript_10805/m.44269 type:complete len:254 (+) Transcript_10805:1345-2106(+)